MNQAATRMVLCGVLGSACVSVPTLRDFVSEDSLSGVPLSATPEEARAVKDFQRCESDPSRFTLEIDPTADRYVQTDPACGSLEWFRDGTTAVGVILWPHTKAFFPYTIPHGRDIVSISPVLGAVRNTKVPHLYVLGSPTHIDGKFLRVLDEERFWKVVPRGPTLAELEASAVTIEQIDAADNATRRFLSSVEDKKVTERLANKRAGLLKARQQAEWDATDARAANLAAPGANATWLEHATYLMARLDAGAHPGSAGTATALTAFNASVEQQVVELGAAKKDASVKALSGFRALINHGFDCNARQDHCAGAAFPLIGRARARWFAYTQLTVGGMGDPVVLAYQALQDGPLYTSADFAFAEYELPAAVAVLEAEAKRLDAAGKQTSAAGLWERLYLSTNLMKTGGAIFARSTAFTMAKDALCREILPNLRDANGASLGRVVALQLRKAPCGGELKFDASTPAVTFALENLKLEWKEEFARTDAQEVRSTQELARANPEFAARRQQEEKLMWRLQQLQRQEEAASQRVIAAQKNVVGRGTYQVRRSKYGDMPIVREQGQQTEQGERDEAEARAQVSAINAEMSRVDAELTQLRRGPATPSTLTTTRVTAQTYSVESQFVRCSASATVRLSDSNQSKPVSGTFVWPGGSRSAGLPAQGVAAWNNWLSSAALRESATKATRDALASSASDLLRPMIQSRIDAALRAHAGELGTPELIKSMFVLEPESH